MTGKTCSPTMPIGWYPMLNTLSGAETCTLPTTKFGDPMLAIPVPAPSPHPTNHTHPHTWLTGSCRSPPSQPLYSSSLRVDLRHQRRVEQHLHQVARTRPRPERDPPQVEARRPPRRPRP